MYDDVALHLAEHRHGAVSTWELAAAGLNRPQIQQLLVSRHWERVTRTVIRREGSTRTVDQEIVIKVLSCGPGSAVSHQTAGRLLGARSCPLRPVTVVGTMAKAPLRLDVGYHRVRRLPERWVTEVRGIPVVAPELCSMQLFAVGPFEVAERSVDVLWSLGRLSGQSIARFLADMGARGRDGVAGLRQYFDERGVAYVPPESGLEGRAIQVLRREGIEVRRQVDVGSDVAWTGRVDLMPVGHPVVIEVQSHLYHASKVNREADATRRASIEASGFVWVELWEDDVWSRPWTLAPKVRKAIRLAEVRRSAHPAPPCSPSPVL